MTDPGTTDERAITTHRPPMEWWLQHIGDLTLEERGDAIKDLVAYGQGLEAVALKKPYGAARMIEDGAFIIGATLLATKSAVEILQDAGFLTYPPNHTGFPLGLILTCVLLIAPKMLGRATAGKVWGAVGDGLAKLVGRGRPAAPGEKDTP